MSQSAANTPETPETHGSRYQVLFFLSLACGIAYIQRAALMVPLKEIASDLDIDLTRDMGRVQSAWYLAYGLMQLPSGWLADRFGSRLVLTLLMVAWSVATLLTAFAVNFISLTLLWSIMGAAQAGALPCAAKALGQIFPESQRARSTALLGVGISIGGALAPVLAATILEGLTPWADSWHVSGWRILLASYAIPGMLWAILFLAVVSARKLPTTHGRSTAAPPIDWSRMFTSGSLMLLCTQQFLRAYGMVFFMTWFPTFLQKARGVTQLESGWLTTCTGVGIGLGGLSGGFFSDWLLKTTGNSRLARQGIACVGMSICAISIVVSYFVQDVNSGIAVITVGCFSAAFGGVSGYTVAISFGGHNVATVFSTMNMFGNLGAALFPVTAGWLVDATDNWNLLLFLFAGIMAMDAVCWAILNPKGTLFGDEE
jgi:MFS family permease